ncbi:MAG: hypothetical protein K0R05_929 [Anaerocolumna sp.]|jgi:hypothetical protein|nr:hypothetical protein [Anaerocolumna sp.]
MKKAIVTTLFLAVAISMSACDKAEVEKKPVIIEDSAQLNLEDPSALAESEDNTATANNDNKKADEETVVKDTKGETSVADDERIAAAEAKAVTMAEEERSNLAAEASAEERKEADGSNSVSEPVRTEPQLVARESSETDEAMAVSIEGTEETVQGKRYKSNQGYEIVYDSERFKRESQENTDSFLAENSDPTIYPYIYVNISRLEDTTVDAYSKELFRRLTSEGQGSVSISTNKEKGQKTSKDAEVTVQTGYKWDSVIRKYHVIGEADKIFLIETQYYLEAEEGYGARLQAMLDTFYIP